jgi:hypothetical protein
MHRAPGDLPDQLITAFDAVTDVALFYFVGHGQIAPDDQLWLGLAQSSALVNARARFRHGHVRSSTSPASGPSPPLVASPVKQQSRITILTAALAFSAPTTSAKRSTSISPTTGQRSPRARPDGDLVDAAHGEAGAVQAEHDAKSIAFQRPHRPA